MIKVNIVTDPPNGRIKRKISERIIQYNTAPIEYSIRTAPRNDVDINFYNCFNHVFWLGLSKVKNVAYITHIHKTIAQHEIEIGKRFDMLNGLDGFLHKSNRTLNQFNDVGIGENKYHEVVWCGIEQEKFKPMITLGIIQNGEVEGKGLYFMVNMLNKYDFKNFKFIIRGVGWELLTKKMDELNIRYEYNTSLDYADYPNEYEKIDYLLIPSLWEGGPMCALEAIACGIPIISADVGWVREIGNCRWFEPGNSNQLSIILDEIQSDRIIKCKVFEKNSCTIIKSNVIEKYTCTAFSNRLAGAFERIISG